MPHPTPRRRRTVSTSPLTPSRGRPRLWAYGYADLAALLGCTEKAVRHLVARERFDPACLESVMRMALDRKPRRWR